MSRKILKPNRKNVIKYTPRERGKGGGSSDIFSQTSDPYYWTSPILEISTSKVGNFLVLKEFPGTKN
jgi:hypothetical protein